MSYPNFLLQHTTYIIHNTLKLDLITGKIISSDTNKENRFQRSTEIF